MSTYSIEIDGLTYTGSLLDVATRYKRLKHYMGGEDGYASQIVCTRDGVLFNMEELLEQMARLFEPA